VFVRRCRARRAVRHVDHSRRAGQRVRCLAETPFRSVPDPIKETT
jgi:hypothetical protein